MLLVSSLLLYFLFLTHFIAIIIDFFFCLSVYFTGPENLAVEAMVCELSFIFGNLEC